MSSTLHPFPTMNLFQFLPTSLLLSIMCMVNADDGLKEFWDACAHGNMELVQKHVDADPEIAKKSTVDGETCLHLTSISNNFDIAELMIDLGADVNARVTHPEGLRMTPLAWHVFSGNVSIINLLIDHNANINDDFDAMYHPEVKITVANVAESLIRKAADGSIEDKFMQTFLALKRRGGVAYSETKAGIADKLADKLAAELEAESAEAESAEAELSEVEPPDAGKFGVKQEL